MASSKFLLFAGLLASLSQSMVAEAPPALGQGRVLFVDETLIARRDGVSLELHAPVARETVLTFDAPWEGSGTDFERLLRVGSTLRMYYMATQLTVGDGSKFGDKTVYACVAESSDGIHWTRPDLGLFEYHGSKHNNIIWAEPKLDNFTPFIDENPACLPTERFKAVSGGRGGLFAYASADGLHWAKRQAEPIMTHGQFDTQNNAFWDPARGQYWCYIRGYHDASGLLVGDTRHGSAGVRDIRVSTSTDFRTWTEPQRLAFDAPEPALYTNQIERYYRAPAIFVGFPTRYVDRPFTAQAIDALPDPAHRRHRMGLMPRYGSVVTDGQFMTSRDGTLFHLWDETFIPPGPQRSNNWVYGDGYQSLGLIETPAADRTAPNELSCYVDEGHWKEGETVRRYTLRIDGFVSVHAREGGGSFSTRTFTESGRRLSLNFATSAAGSIRVELQDEAGRVIAGYAAADCDELFGDRLDGTVSWHGRSDLSALAGRALRLRVELAGADLYSLVFAP